MVVRDKYLKYYHLSMCCNENFKPFHHFQVKLTEKTSLLETAEGKIVELTAKVNEQQRLIQKLEDDILKV